MNYNDTFKKVLDGLNDRQRQAVEAIEGPVMVIAGPGTGKTHILGARIGQILQQTDVYPHHVLCLTYTDSGAFAMRERLLKFIGTDAYKVPIYTFHSFCNTVIQDNLDHFGVQEIEPISELERVDLIRKLIDKLPDGHVLKSLKSSPYNFEKHLKHLFETMKAELWQPPMMIEKIATYLEALPTNPLFLYKRKTGSNKAGDPKTAQIAEEVKRMKRLQAAVELFEGYETALAEAKRYDFADMLLWVAEAFRNDLDLLRSYQEQFLYVLVDEFQDTNGIQNTILNLLTDYWAAPNVFVVGDDDQAIYEFQGARLKNIQQFYERYQQDIQLVVLDKNYRSSQQILDTAERLIAVNKLRLVHQLVGAGVPIEKKFFAANAAVAQLPTAPRIVTYHNGLHEVADIALQIERLQQQGVALNEIAVIYSKHKQAKFLIKLLEQKNIAYQTKRRVNILETVLVQNILTIFKYIQQEFERPHSKEALLFEILHFEFLHLAQKDLTKLAFFMAKDEQKSDLTWRKLLADAELLQRLDLEAPEKILNLTDLLEQLIVAQHNLPLPQFFERLINRSGLLRFVTESSEKAWLLQCLTTLFNFVEDEAARKPKSRVKDLLMTLQLMEKNRIGLELQKAFFAENGVQLLTAHSSKGLEFGYVFMLDCADEWLPQKRNNNKFTMPPNLTLSGAEDELEAARRLFYVGMTRAKYALQLSVGRQDADGKPKEAVQFLKEIDPDGTLAVSHYLDDNAVLEAQIALLTETEKPQVAPLSSAEADALLEGFSLSPTVLSNFLACPLSFYYENLLKVPQASNEALAYGTAAHEAVRWWAEALRNNEATPTFDGFFRAFEREMNRQKKWLTGSEYARRVELGRRDLALYFKNRQANFQKNELLHTELELRQVVVNGVPCRGTVDKIERLTANHIRIVDYKTGKFVGKKIKPPTEENPNGGDYWRQLVFYKILLENYRNATWTVKEAVIDYLEPDKKEQNRLEVIALDAAAVATVKEQIAATYQRIKAHDFYTGCGKAACRWCKFAQKHELHDRYSAERETDLDDF